MRVIGLLIVFGIIISLSAEVFFALAIALGAVVALGLLGAFLDKKTSLFKSDESYNPDYMVQLKLDESKNPIYPSPEALADYIRTANETELPKKGHASEEEWLENRVRPEPQAYGVSPEGAERLVAEWLIYLGEDEVETTQFQKDGGVDVVTRNLSVQVKNFGKGSVSSAEANAIFGVATADGKTACIFTSSSLSPDALKFADRTDMIAISYDAQKATLKGLNKSGKDFLKSGKYLPD